MYSERFKNRVAVITGGASGVGQDIGIRIAAEGGKVSLWDRDAAQLAKAAAAVGPAAHTVQVDVTDPAKLESAAAAVYEKFGRIDVLVASAGITGPTAKLWEYPLEEWRRVIDIDLTGVFHGCKAAIPVMKAQGGGAIINTASASGLAGDYSFTAYNAAKGGVVNYTRAAGIDHARDGVRINAVCPGPVDTPIIAGIDEWPGVRDAWNERVPMGRFARAEEIASVVAFLASDDASYMTGAIIAVDGGLTAHTGQPNLPRMLAGL